MNLNAPFIASPLQAPILLKLNGLVERSRAPLSDADKVLGIELLTDVYCDLIDTTITQLLKDINTTHTSKVMTEAHDVVEDIKNKAREYLRWVAGLLANDRLPPVIRHFHGLVHHLDQGNGVKPYLAFGISTQLADDAGRVLATLRDGSAARIDEGIELLIKAIEEAIQPLVMTPKELMNFNLIVDKTINGIVAIVRALFKRMLRKLGPHLPRELYPRVADHLDSFLVMTPATPA